MSAEMPAPRVTRVLHGLALLCCTLVFGLTLAHVLQSPGSRTLDGTEWLDVMHTFYGGFAAVGGVTEILGLVLTAVLAVLALSRRLLFPGIAFLVAALCLLGTVLAYWFGNRPVNALVAVWTPATLPGDWSAYRASWEAAHAVSTGLSALAFIGVAVVLLRRAYPLRD